MYVVELKAKRIKVKGFGLQKLQNNYLLSSGE